MQAQQQRKQTALTPHPSPLTTATTHHSPFSPSLPTYQVTLEGVARIGSFYMPFTTPGIRCVPLFTSSDSVTDIGPMVILGMPFLREYVTRFDRTSESMAFARLRDNSICNACADGHGGGVKAAEEKGES